MTSTASYHDSETSSAADNGRVIDLITLRYFVTVAGELHFRRAAKKLNMTQGPLSIAIRKLEDELETELFERSSRSVKLTAAGEFFLEEANAVLKRAELARKRLNDFVSGAGREFSIGYNEPALHTVLTDFLRLGRQTYPESHWKLHELETPEQLKKLRDGVLDIGFMRPYSFDLSGLESKLLHRETYKLAVPCDHKLADAEKITAEMLSGQTVILFARDINPRLFDLLCAKLTASSMPAPEFRQDARSKSSALAMVRAGFGAALLPESSFLEVKSDIVIRSVDVELPVIDIMAVWNPETIPEVLKRIMNSNAFKQCSVSVPDKDR